MNNQKLKCVRSRRGFSLLEVLVAMMIVSIVLTAAATMAGALSGAKEANDQISRDITTLLQIQTRLSDLVMRANKVVEVTETKLVLWHDDNADRVEDASTECTTIETNGTNLTIYKDASSKEIYLNCQLASVWGYPDALNTEWIKIDFTMAAEGTIQMYSVRASLRAKN